MNKLHTMNWNGSAPTAQLRDRGTTTLPTGFWRTKLSTIKMYIWEDLPSAKMLSIFAIKQSHINLTSISPIMWLTIFRGRTGELRQLEIMS